MISADAAPQRFEVHVFPYARRPDLALLCQRLRYAIYHRDLGLDTPDMDHEAAIDIEANDPICDFVAVTRPSGEVIGTIRLQPRRPEGPPLYAELEFELLGPFWRDVRCVEGARFAVAEPYRGGRVPLLLFAAFRDYCRERAMDHLVSVVVVPDAEARPALARGILRWLAPRVGFALDRGAPQPSYVHPDLPLITADQGEAIPVEAEDVPPMLRMLAGPRTTLCSPPAYCRRFHTWNLLFVTRL
jgi:hypothetical protein